MPTEPTRSRAFPHLSTADTTAYLPGTTAAIQRFGRYARPVLLSSVFVVAVSAPVFLRAQGGAAIPASQSHAARATVSVRVTDISKSVIAHASVVLVNQQTQARSEVVSDAEGIARIEGIAPGHYRLAVEVPGFASYVLEDVLVRESEELTLAVAMKVAGHTEQISVTAIGADSYTVAQGSSTAHLNTPLMETPQNIVSVSGQILKDQQATDISGVLGNVSGLSQGTPNPFLRPDFYIRGFLADQNKLRNGVGGFDVSPYEDAAIIDHVEFIKGPASFVIANAQPGGVLNIVTKQPLKDRYTELDLMLGTDSLYRGSLDSGGSLTSDKKLYYRLNAAANRQRTATQYYGFDRYVVAPVLAYDPTPKTHLLFEYNFTDGISIGGTDPSLPSVNGTYFVLPNNFFVADYTLPNGYAKSHYLRAQAEQTITPDWKLTAQVVRYTESRFDWNLYEGYDDLKTLNETGIYYRHLDLWETRAHNTVFQSFADGRVRTGSVEHRLLVGVDIAKITGAVNDGDDPTSIGLDTRHPVYGVPFSTYLAGWTIPNDFIVNKYGESYSWAGGYAQDSLKLGRRLVLTAAGRYTSFHQPQMEAATQTSGAFTPRGGATFLLSPNHSLYGLFDQAFLAQPGNSYDGKNFKPLRGNNLEFGYKAQGWNGRLLASASVYRIVKNNLLTTDPLHPNFSIQQDRAVAHGFETDLVGEIAPNTNLVANYTFSKALTRVSDGDYEYPTRLVPLHDINVWLKHTFPRWKGLGTGIGFNAPFHRPATDGEQQVVYMPNYALLNGALSYPLGERLHLDINVNNILNQRYMPGGGFYSTAFSVPTWLYLPSVPRTARFNLRYRF